MIESHGSEPDFDALADLDWDTDELFDVLSDSRRRFVLTCLQEYAGALALRDVADELAVREHGASIKDIPAAEVESIRRSLYHVHVPKMADAGVVKFSKERNAVALAEGSEELTSLVARPTVQ